MTDLNAADRQNLLNGANNRAFVPRLGTITGFASEAARQPGVALRALVPGTTIVVKTRNSTYRLTVADGGPDTVLIRGGALFRDATPAQVQGATLGGPFVKVGWIGVGLRMELRVGLRRFLTSPVDAIRLGRSDTATVAAQ